MPTAQQPNQPLHNDEPVLRDGLNRTALIQEIGDAVATCIPPQVLGIHGDWGLGKTSLMHQIHLYLTGDCPQYSDADVKAVLNSTPPSDTGTYPEGAYRLLEGIKMFLTLPNCVFVLGMNQQIVEDAIGKHVPLADKEDKPLRQERAAAYLEKLCQNIWRLPRVHDPKSYLLNLLPDTVVTTWIGKAMRDIPCLPSNPRRIKGLANLLNRFSGRLPQQHGEPENKRMIREARWMLIVAYVYQFHHDLFRFWESDPKVYDVLLEWVRRENLDLKEEPLKPILDRLQRAVFIKKEGTGDSIAYEINSAFPDPANSGVFWIQQLIHEGSIEVETEPVLPTEQGGQKAISLAQKIHKRYVLGLTETPPAIRSGVSA